jgi:hypothetical protein
MDILPRISWRIDGTQRHFPHPIYQREPGFAIAGGGLNDRTTFSIVFAAAAALTACAMLWQDMRPGQQ